MKLGPHEIGHGAVLAPMAGVTNPPFRQLCSEMGAIFAVTELVSSHAVVFLDKKSGNRLRKHGSRTLALMDKFPGESPFIVQLYGRDPEVMAQAACIVEAQGADIIDLNFGCPVRKVVKNGLGCGAALMRDPLCLGEITRRVVESVRVPVTAKTRIGYSADDRNGVQIAKILEDCGVKLIIVHARTREQGHGGFVDLAMLGEMVDAVNIPVIGNGGITGPADAREMIERTGCDRVAVGQGAKGNPWIFREIAGGEGAPDLASRVDTCRRHLDLYVNWSGEQRAVLEMRKHACWYLKGFDGAAAFRKQLGQAINADAFSRLLDQLPV